MSLRKSSVVTALLLNNAVPARGVTRATLGVCVLRVQYFTSNSSVYDQGGARPDTCEASKISSNTGKLQAVARSHHLLLV